MAKTNFNDGSYLTPSFMDTFFGTNAGSGHNHQGLDADGSAPQITLSSDADDYITGTILAEVRTPFSDVLTVKTWYYTRIGRVVTMFLPDGHFVHSTANDFYEVSPPAGTGVWPAAVVPTNAQLIPVVLSKENVTLIFKVGAIGVNQTAGNNWKCYMPDASSELSTAGFGFNDTGPKGLFNQSFTYTID
jgi:hypothetical protein